MATLMTYEQLATVVMSSQKTGVLVVGDGVVCTADDAQRGPDDIEDCAGDGCEHAKEIWTRRLVKSHILDPLKTIADSPETFIALSSLSAKLVAKTCEVFCFGNDGHNQAGPSTAWMTTNTDHEIIDLEPLREKIAEALDGSPEIKHWREGQAYRVLFPDSRHEAITSLAPIVAKWCNEHQGYEIEGVERNSGTFLEANPPSPSPDLLAHLARERLMDKQGCDLTVVVSRGANHRDVEIMRSLPQEKFVYVIMALPEDAANWELGWKNIFVVAGDSPLERHDNLIDLLNGIEDVGEAYGESDYARYLSATHAIGGG